MTNIAVFDTARHERMGHVVEKYYANNRTNPEQYRGNLGLRFKSFV